MMKKTLSALVAWFFVVSALAGGQGLVQDRFSDGWPVALLTFPQTGGVDSNLSVDLPRHITVNSATMDIEGRGKTYGTASGFIDFADPEGSTAFDGTLSRLPPSGNPAGFEGNNITLDGGLQKSDNRRTPARAANSVPYQLFEFDLTEVFVADFDFMWEGTGVLYPASGTETSSALLFAYNNASGKWENMDSYDLGGPARDDQFLWANVGSGASAYLDSRNHVCLMVTVPQPMIGQYTGLIETDYVAFWNNGTRTFFPGNVTLDVGADGSAEWQSPGKLRGKTSFSGDAFVNAVQAALDASSLADVRIPLEFSSDCGGALYISNLSIDYDLRNLPPEVNGTLPTFEMQEDQSATALLDLWDWFQDDAGARSLEFAVVHEEDSTKLDASLNTDGHHLDFFAAPDWYGQLGFQVRATDAEGLSAEAAIIVRVLSVNDPPRLGSAGPLVASQGVMFDKTFPATDPDLGIDPEELLTFSTNSTHLALEPDTGRAWFTPENSQVGVHLFSLTVTDNYGASDTKNLTLRVDNLNEPPTIAPVTDQSATEDQPFGLQLVATDPDLAIGMDTLTWEDSSPLFAIAQNGTIAFTPLNKDVGVHQVSVSATDVGGLKAWANFTLTVVNVNDPPLLSALADQTVEEDKELSVRATASDEDAGETFTFSTSDPLVRINATGWITYRPTQKEVGLHHVTITVRDAAGASATMAFNITVLNINDPPREVRILAPAHGTAFKPGEEIAFSGNATDDDGDALDLTWYSGDEVIGTGATFSTKALKPGVHVITLKADDGSGPVASEPVHITVKKKAASPSKGFLPGFTLLALLAAGAAGALASERSRRKG